MSWGKVDDRLHRHRKVRRARLEAMGLWVVAMSFSRDNKTGGRLEWDDIVALCGSEPRPNLTAKRARSRLVAAGLWDTTGAGTEQEPIQFHDWEDYQPNEAQDAERTAKATAAARARWDAREHAPSIATPDAPRMPRARVPSPTPTQPLPIEPPESPAGDGAPVFELRPAESPPEPAKPRSSEPKAASRYAEAYAQGQVDAGADGFAPPRATVALVDAACGHARGPDGKPLRGEELLAWFRSASADYRRATEAEAKWQQGFSPKKFLEWLQGGRRSSARTDNKGRVMQGTTAEARKWVEGL